MQANRKFGQKLSERLARNKEWQISNILGASVGALEGDAVGDVEGFAVGDFVGWREESKAFCRKSQVTTGHMHQQNMILTTYAGSRILGGLRRGRLRRLEKEQK